MRSVRFCLNLVLAAALALGAGAAIPALSQTTSTNSTPEGYWAEKAPLLTAHGEVAVTALNGKVYVEGGSLSAGHMVLALNEEYDPATDHWRERAPLPQPLTHLGVAAFKGKLYVFGGFSDPVVDHKGAVDAAYEYNPATDRWRTLAPMNAPRGSVGAAALGNKIYVVGGRGLDLKTVATNEAYDPASNRWTELAPLPAARDHLAEVAVDGQIHVIGGRFGSSRDLTGLHDVYDPKKNAWQTAPPMPTPRSSVAAALYQGSIVVAGGECNQGHTFNETEAYDVEGRTWTTLEPLPAGRHGFGAATVGQYLYVAGGALGCGGGGISSEFLALLVPQHTDRLP